MTRKKYQVFISSTYNDLLDERQAAVEAVLKAGHIPAGMELFRAGKQQLETIKRWIDESDVYLLIVGRRYGTVESSSRMSYTELEYRYALEEQKMPGFAIVMSDDWATTKLKAGAVESDVYELDNKQSFEKFLGFVKTKIVSFAGTPAEVKLAIHENLREMDEIPDLRGWVRSNGSFSDDKIALLVEVQEENKALRETIGQLRQERTAEMPKDLVDITTSIKVRCTYRYNGQKKEKVVELTWEKLFAIIAPELISHVNEDAVSTMIDTYLFSMTGLALDSISSKSLAREDFLTIRTQLVAYGLVDVQNLKITVGGMALFWVLTKQGKQKMYELRTVKNKS